jgi:hypothetical protein
MAKMAAQLAARTAVAILVIGAVPAAAAEPNLTVVVRVDDLAGVPAQTLVDARRIAGRIYASIGVKVVWTSDHRPAAAAPAAMRLEALLLSRTREQSLLRGTGAAKTVLGYAPPSIGRVYLFYHRIAAFASASGEHLGSVLGRALAHEIGHQLLPAHGHSDTGIMRAEIDYRSLGDPQFTADQQKAIQSLLAAARS